MKKPFVASLLLLCLSAIPSIAQINAIDYWYISTSGSVDWHRETEILNTATKENIKYDTGWDAKLSGGLQADNWRLELEGSYRINDIDSVRASDFPTGLAFDTSVGGHIENWSLMVNFFYDIPLVKKALFLYFGAGAGASYMNLEVNSFTGTLTGGSTNFGAFSDNDVLFAWQLMAGLSLDIPTRSLAIPFICPYVGYRLFATTEPKGFSRNVGTNNLDTRHEYFPYVNSVEVGFRFKF